MKKDNLVVVTQVVDSSAVNLGDISAFVSFRWEFTTGLNTVY